jgi:hypothetical protein
MNLRMAILRLELLDLQAGKPLWKRATFRLKFVHLRELDMTDRRLDPRVVDEWNEHEKFIKGVTGAGRMPGFWH